MNCSENVIFYLHRKKDLKVSESNSQGYSRTHVSPRKIALSFGRKAADYNQFAMFQSIAIDQIIESYADKFKDGHIWTDLGCGSGLFLKSLHKHGIDCPVAGTDISFNSLKIASKLNRKLFQSDISTLPLRTSSIDGIIVSSVLQWIEDLEMCLKEFNRCLKGTGTLLFSAFIEGSFRELNTVRKQSGLSVPVNIYSSSTFLSFLDRCGFSVQDSHIIVKTYYFRNAFDALKSIKNYGATATSGTPLTRNRLNDFMALYEKLFTDKNGVPVTYMAINGYAKKA